MTTGKIPDPTSVIKNLPAGVKEVKWAQTPDVSKPGQARGKVMITYPDGSQKIIDVSIEVDPVTVHTAQGDDAIKGNRDVKTQKEVLTENKDVPTTITDVAGR